MKSIDRSNQAEYLVQMKNIHKSFAKEHALDGVDFDVGYAEVVGLIGDNGAGKSTLIKILSGLFPPDSGEIYYKGELVKNHTIQKSFRMGIATVYQERALVENQPLWRNVFIGRETTKKLGFLDIKSQKETTDHLMKEVIGFTSRGLSSDSIVKALSGGEKQGIAIGRALLFKADLIILDEPTIALSISETEKVLEYVRKAKNEGKSCIFITHNIYHVYPVADRLVILDRGKIKAEFKKEEISLEELVQSMRAIAARAGDRPMDIDHRSLLDLRLDRSATG